MRSLASSRSDTGGYSRFLPDIVLLASVAALVTMGLLSIYSVTQHFSTPAQYVFKQSLALLLGCAGALVIYFLDLEKLRRARWIVAGGSVLVLLYLLVPGAVDEINGAKRWIDLGPLNVQPSDFVKIGLVFFLADMVARRQRHLHEFLRGFVPPVAAIALLAGLIVLQPDYGTAFLCGLVGMTILYLAGARLLHLFLTCASGVGLLFFALVHDPERLERIVSFLDVEGNKKEGAYQLYMSLVSISSGGLDGVGLGEGRGQRGYLPEPHTDFVFSILAEEHGAVVGCLVVLAFLLIGMVCLWQLRRAHNSFQYLLVSGCALIIAYQALINFGVTMGLLPTKGIALPFVSYGGSNLLCMCVIVGVILNCFRRWRSSPVPGATEVRVSRRFDGEMAENLRKT